VFGAKSDGEFICSPSGPSWDPVPLSAIASNRIGRAITATHGIDMPPLLRAVAAVLLMARIFITLLNGGPVVKRRRFSSAFCAVATLPLRESLFVRKDPKCIRGSGGRSPSVPIFA
jgi:hypothetical protein